MRSVRASTALARYVAPLRAATRQHPYLEVGASPRAGMLLLGAARAHAAIDGREFVLPATGAAPVAGISMCAATG